MKDWKVCSALLRGLSHDREDTPCQDNLEIIELENGFAAALADGVGSLQYSHYASMLATRTTVAWLGENAEALFSMADKQARKEYTAQHLLERIRTVLQEQAQLQQIDIKKMDCNLAFCLLDTTKDIAILGQLGDCAICLLADDAGPGIRERGSLVLSDRGGLANSTCTVMSGSAAERLTVTRVNLKKRGYKGILMTSDGLEGVVYRKNSTLVRQDTQEIFNEIYRFDDQSSRLERTLERIREDSRGYLDDDISMVLLSRGDTPLVLARDPQWTCRCGHRNPLDITYCAKCSADMLRQYKDVDFSAQEYGMDGYFLEHEEPQPDPPAPEPPPAEPVSASDPAQEPPEKIPVPRKYAVVENPLPPEPHEDRPVRPKSNRPKGNPKGGIGNAGVIGSRKKPPQEPIPPELAGVNDTIPVSGNFRSGAYDPLDPPEKKPRNPVFTGILIAALVILLVMLLMCLVTWILDTPPTSMGENRPPVMQTQPPVDSPVLELGQDKYYIGEVRNKLPHGCGTLVDGDTVYSGTFRNGKKDGIFTVTKLGSDTVCQVVEYEDGEAEQILYNSDLALNRTQYRVRTPIDQLYKDADHGAERIVVKLEPGDIVYGTNAEEVKAELSGTIWIEIELMDGNTGWCTSGYLTEISGSSQP